MINALVDIFVGLGELVVDFMPTLSEENLYVRVLEEVIPHFATFHILASNTPFVRVVYDVWLWYMGIVALMYIYKGIRWTIDLIRGAGDSGKEKAI